MKFHVIVFFSLLGINSAVAFVWTHDSSRKWNHQFETQYSEWVENSVDTDFLTHPGSLFRGLQVDCADLPYLLRIIFSMRNGLEFAINDPTNPGKIISSLKSQLRLYDFVKHVLAVTSTQTLPQDTYLVAMNPSGIKPGAILLGDLNRGHTMVVKKISPSGIPVLIYGSLPAREFLYLSYHFPDSRSYFPMGPITLARGGGIRQFKWPQDVQKPPNKIADFSDDQIKAGRHLDTYFAEVQKSVRLQPTTPDEEMNYLIDDLCSQVRVRANAITDAINFLTQINNRRLTAAEDDRYSTNKRDESIRLLIKKLRSDLQLKQSQLNRKTLERIENVLKPKGRFDDECLVDWAANRIEPLGWIIERFENSSISSKADDTLARRWGH